MADKFAVEMFHKEASAWNGWARSNPNVILDFTGHEFEEADFSNRLFPGNTFFDGTVFPKDANFMQAQFLGNVDFEGARFESTASFKRTQFRRTANFHKALFRKAVEFNDADFHESVDFSRIIASEWADFTDAKFEDGAEFLDSHFGSVVSFQRCVFKGPVSFRRAQFELTLNFKGATTESTFTIEGGVFAEAPDFTDTIFRLPPRFDRVHIHHSMTTTLKRADPRPMLCQRLGFVVAASPAFAARFRRLKGLAVEGHDHINELDFFAEEMRSRRFWIDKSWKVWPSLLYQWTSNFGRSIVRPLAWLAVTWLVFLVAYLATSANATFEKRIIADAAILSWLNLIPILGWSKASEIQSLTLSLYGSSHFPPIISIIATFNSLLGAVFIFLVLLGIRNRFKIK